MALRDWFIKDLGWKLFSIVLAVVIWLTVNNILLESGNYTVPVAGEKQIYDDLPVLVVSESSDVRNYRVLPGMVSVTVSGPPNVMAILQANQIRAVADLTGIESDNEKHRHVDVSTPAGVTLVSVKPSSVDVIIPSPGKQP
ncbi:MAG: hypothetical protein ABSA45_07730 [Verrucomicrobiota bacterium]